MNNPWHLTWVVFGALVGFGASSIFGDLLTLFLDLYYLIYFGITLTFFTIYIKKTHLNLREWFSRRLFLGILLGLIFGALMVQNVLSRPETEKFTGPYFAWLIFWRGLIYGAIDGLLLSVFPWIVTWRAFNVEKKPLGKKIAFGLLAWLFILVVTTAYHLGYSDFRSKKIIQPNVGNTIMSVPTLVSANPIGSPMTHAIMHITAVIHSPKTELFLPPHRE
jgi:magnesium-transporting ATPase (P-type)